MLTGARSDEGYQPKDPRGMMDHQILFSLSTSLPLYLSTSLPLYLSTSLPLYLSTSLPLYLSTSLPLYLSTSLPLYLSTSLPLYLSNSHHNLQLCVILINLHKINKVAHCLTIYC
jgi:hypothetical protein